MSRNSLLTSLAGKANAAVVAVCGRLEAELAEMEEAEAAELLDLGRYLDHHVSTGAVCTYDPPEADPLEWVLD